ncbi:OmpA family protein [Sulfurimonas sp.]|uniref:OmpA family protein n=1 Tax=Sulfurimonas sp. TaxID=2022749 RepID=UPI00260763EC|nr:OmpA family protein [Sulfurimonas sp.]
MKKLLLIPALMLTTASFANDYKYELSPMIGYNFAEGNLDIKNDGYLTGGLELQFNTPTSKISPEFSLFYARPDYKGNGETNIVRGAFNGVYEYAKQDFFTPFAKLGLGIENISDENRANQTGFFVDAGAGAKVDLTDNLALKLEAIYMAKVAHQNAGNADSNLMTLVGLSYSFGAQAQKSIIKEKIIVEETIQVAPVVVAELDDDNDGVVNSKDECANTPADTEVNAVGCTLVKDSDNDGVIDSLDTCANTPANTKVDAHGCKEDMDNDGVLNANDICPNTEVGEAVNSDGCPKSITLNVSFENNSFHVKENSFANLGKYAKFLKTYTNYSAKIVGFTDSRGSEAYNQKLSQKRADEVKKLLIQRGVNPSQLSSVGMGEANPVADNASEEGRAKNRRIEAELTRN